MALTTPTYLLFFSICFALYWLARKRDLQNGLLVIFSYIFYATWDSRFGLLLFITSLIDYSVGLSLARTKSLSARRALLALSICSGLGALAFFKYFNFFAENLRSLAELVGWHFDLATLNFLLPVGISFYTFKSLSYTIDVYRRDVEPTANLTAYLAYVAFFPQLLAGPIDRAGNLLQQLLVDRRFNYERTVAGCRQILWGLFKKMVLADNLAPVVNLAYAQAAARPGPHLLFATICFAFQIYCDFSAYSDIAIGCARLLGLESVINFAHPYFSESPVEFWRRWHISLMSWFRDYVFFPLGGIRRSRLRRAFNVLLTFLLSGLWHGASWNFIIWGGINGVAVLPAAFRRRRERGLQKSANQPWSSVLKASKILLTFLFICLTWVFFRAPDLPTAFLILRKIFAEALNISAYRSISGLAYPYVDYPLAGRKLFLFLFGFIVIEALQNYRLVNLERWPGIIRWLVYNGLLFLIFYFGTYMVGQFYYYQF
ncbi:MAG TPA: MBOAT family O-acyltransferase [Pyrinomonadaceae bacterium]|nr:MBOAT family O-acyltransferase [Pyrinomonadaceae bacterium]